MDDIIYWWTLTSFILLQKWPESTDNNLRRSYIIKQLMYFINLFVCWRPWIYAAFLSAVSCVSHWESVFSEHVHIIAVILKLFICKFIVNKAFFKNLYIKGKLNFVLHAQKLICIHRCYSFTDQWILPVLQHQDVVELQPRIPLRLLTKRRWLNTWKNCKRKKKVWRRYRMELKQPMHSNS